MTEKKRDKPVNLYALTVVVLALLAAGTFSYRQYESHRSARQDLLRKIMILEVKTLIPSPIFKEEERELAALLHRYTEAQNDINAIFLKGVYAALVVLGASILLRLLFNHFFRQHDVKRMRGARLDRAFYLNWANRKLNQGHHDWPRLGVDGVRIPLKKEVEHTLLCGSTGTGKSTLLYHWVNTVRKRKQRAIILDPGGEFAQRFYREGDVILNPFDVRFPGWSIFNEMRHASDADRLSKSIVPDISGDNQEWNHYAQALVCDLLTSMSGQNDHDQERFLSMLTCGSKAMLTDYLAGQPSQALLEDGVEKMFGSVRAIVGTYVRPYTRTPLGTFSIRDWVKDEGASCLFLTFADAQLQSMKPLLAAWLDIAISEVLSLPSSDDRRVWFFLDEISSIGHVQGIMDLLTRARKQGGAAVVGLQSIAQFKALYGDKNAQSLQSCLTTNVVLRCADAETAEAMSVQLGTREIKRQIHSTDDRRTHVSEQIVDSRLVMASELQTLRFLEGYVQISGPGPVVKVKIPFYKGCKTQSAGFEPAPVPDAAVRRRSRREEAPC